MAEDGCDCEFCRHNQNGECHCQPCDWIRSRWSVRELKQSGHTFWTGDD